MSCYPFLKSSHCVESVLIWSFSGPYFLAFGLNAERYSLSLRIQSKCGKMRTRKAPNTRTFHAMSIKDVWQVPKYASVLDPIYSCLKDTWQFITSLVLGVASSTWLLTSLRIIFQNAGFLWYICSHIGVESRKSLFW